MQGTHLQLVATRARRCREHAVERAQRAFVDRCRARSQRKFDDVLKTLDKSAVSYQVVLTKADQVKPAELEATIAAVTSGLAKHPAAFPEILVTSSRSGAGMPELRAAMVRLLAERS